MQLDTHVRNLLDMLANSGQPKIWELAPAEARNMALALTQMVEGKEPIAKIEEAPCQARKAHYPSACILLHRQVPNARVYRVFPWRGLDFRQPRYTRLHVQDARQREWLPCHFGWIIDLRRNTSFPPAWKTPMPPPNGLPLMPPVLVSTLPVSSSRDTSAGGNLAAVVCQQAKTGGPKIALQVLFCPVVDIGAETNRASILLKVIFLKDR